MKTPTDYVFSTSWQLAALELKPGEQILVARSMGDLKAGERVRFIGFEDVDNHFGIFVFTGPNGELLEVRGDFSSPDHGGFKALKRALGRGT